jgi:hypothetical protein
MGLLYPYLYLYLYIFFSSNFFKIKKKNVNLTVYRLGKRTCDAHLMTYQEGCGPSVCMLFFVNQQRKLDALCGLLMVLHETDVTLM